jgi:hypothetical protein
MQQIERNKNEIFILPILRKSADFYGVKFENVYLEYDSDEKIKLIFNSEPSKGVNDFLTKNDLYLSKDKVNSKIIYTIKVPEEYVNDIIKYKNGKYSKLSKSFKTQIIINNRDINVGDVLYPKDRTRKLLEQKLDAVLPKDSEVYDIIDEREYWKYIGEKIKIETSSI